MYVTRAIDRKIGRVLKGQLRTAKLEDCLRQRSLIRKYLIPELDSSPWVMVHGDLSGTNIIIDTKHDISGLVEKLSSVATDPSHQTLELTLGTSQELLILALPNIFHCNSQPSSQDSSLVWRSKNTETKRRDRQLFLETIKNLCHTHGEICESFYRVLSSKDEIRRYWWFTAVSNQKLHQVMVKVNWLLRDEEWADEDLASEWELFQRENPSILNEQQSL